jgi:hypothetical protein
MAECFSYWFQMDPCYNHNRLSQSSFLAKKKGGNCGGSVQADLQKMSKYLKYSLQNWRDGWLSWLGKWVAKLVAHLLAAAALWVRIQTYPKIKKMGNISKEVANTL